MLKTLQNDKSSEHCRDGASLLEASQPTQESDQLSLPLDKGKAVDETVEVVMAIESPKVVPPLSLEVACTQMVNHEVQELRQQLDLAIQAKNDAESSLRRMKHVQILYDILPMKTGDLRWVLWARHLQQQSGLCSQLMRGLLKYAMQSDESLSNVQSSHLRLKEKFDAELKDPEVCITVWGNMDRMFERLNHGRTYESDNIN